MSKEKDIFVGFDVGSSFVHYAVLDENKEVVYSPNPLMHFANPIGTIKEAWQDIIEKFDKKRIKNTSFTGSGAVSFKSVFNNVCFEFDSVAIPKGAKIIAPYTDYIFHIGAKDPYFFHLNQIGNNSIIQEWRTGSKCGGGSGILIEKQCRRLFEDEVACFSSKNERSNNQLRMEEMFKKAEQEAAKSKSPSEFLARCGVVIQSDLIHKQNEGATRQDNIAGLFKTVARNYKIDVLGREIPACKAIATGGVLTNALIRKNLEEFLGFPIELPEHYHNIAAIGIALKGIENKGNCFVFEPEELDKVADYGQEERQFAPALSDYLKMVNAKHEELDLEIKSGTDVVIGIDGGSTTTKGTLVDLNGKLLDKIYIKTHGDPEKALKNVIQYLSRHKDNVNVHGVGATGSARKLYERILLSKKVIDELTAKGISVTDKITDEITCHALGIKQNNYKVDTIFEIGGQDMKFTRFSDKGTVKEAKMNYSCQAGSGQTLENLADIIDLDVKSTLQEYGLRAERTPIIDATCGVFMEMDINRLISEGFSREEIASAILLATSASYYYKFVGGEQNVGEICSAQGGPPLGKGFLAAMAQVTGKMINAYPHREMFGAFGAALDVIENIKEIKKTGKDYSTSFRGWGIVDMPLKKEQIHCHELLSEKSCGVRNCLLDIFSIEDDRIVTAGFCPKGNSEASGHPKIDYVKRYHSVYEKHFKKYGMLFEEFKGESSHQNIKSNRTIGIRRATNTLGPKGIWSAALLNRLGFEPVISPKSNYEIARIGVEKTRTEFCVARKLVTGHAMILNEHPDIKYLFNPSFIEHKRENPPNLKYCIYTESEGYILSDVLSIDKDKQISPCIHYGNINLLIQNLKSEFNRLNFRFTTRKIKQAIKYADSAKNEFEKELYGFGDKFLENIQKMGEKGYIGIGRDYVLLDSEASSDSGAMFSQTRGLNYIPQIFLEHKFKDIDLSEIVENEYWVESERILQAHLWVAKEQNLFPIRMMNFSCGPDSLKIYQEEAIQQAADKPMLSLLTDAQTNNAPFVTRCEAYERVVQQSIPNELNIKVIKRRFYPKEENQERVWLIPYMGDGSFVISAACKYFGIKSHVLPTKTKLGYKIATRHINTEVCYPLKGVTGDTLSFLKEKAEEKGLKYVNKHYLILLPSADGPCRFGKFGEVVREFANKEGFEDVPIVGPSSGNDYADIPIKDGAGSLQKILFKGIYASDILEDVTLRIRPYAKNMDDEVNSFKKARLIDLSNVIENGADTREMVKWAEMTACGFKKIELKTTKQFPLVLYIGEIYMRQHDPYTDNVIMRLEKQGLEMIRSPITEWLDYTNRINQRESKRNIILDIKNLNSIRGIINEAKRFTGLHITERYMDYVKKKLSAPFNSLLKGRHVLPDMAEVISILEREHEYHGDIQGESLINSGIAYYFIHDLIKPKYGACVCGIFHVGPFTCMQEGVATAKMEGMAKELRKKQADLVFPVIHAFFGDSPDMNLDCEIAVFKEQCYQKMGMM